MENVGEVTPELIVIGKVYKLVKGYKSTVGSIVHFTRKARFGDTRATGAVGDTLYSPNSSFTYGTDSWITCLHDKYVELSEEEASVWFIARDQ